jgi:predicted Na+-dependent transporter
MAVLVAVAIGLSVQRPLAWTARHQGINILLALLVFATGITIGPGQLRKVGRAWSIVVTASVVGITVLPALAWAASRLVGAGSLREGVMAAGVAPCEIASVATTAMAGGSAALAAGVLICSTLATVALAGPILTLEAGSVPVHSAHLVVNLALVVALPLAAGLGLGAARALSPKTERGANWISLAAVAGLVALIAAEVHLSTRYLALAGALLAFLVASALVGRLLCYRGKRAETTAVLLTISMRDFAIAAGLAANAFGTKAAAPLGLYGVLVLVWGTASAGLLRARATRAPGGGTSLTSLP